MDGTLVYIPITIEKFLQNSYKQLGLNFDIKQISEAQKETNVWLTEYLLATQWTRTNLIKSNYRTLKTLGVRDNLQVLSERVQEFWDNLPNEASEELYLEVRDVLITLKERGYNLGILSGRYHPYILKSLERHNLEHYFSCLVSPQIAGSPRGKGSPHMWEYACINMQCEPYEVLHVDDDRDAVIAGLNAGFNVCLVDRESKCDSSDDYNVIGDLTSILELLE